MSEESNPNYNGMVLALQTSLSGFNALTTATYNNFGAAAKDVLGLTASYKFFETSYYKLGLPGVSVFTAYATSDEGLVVRNTVNAFTWAIKNPYKFLVVFRGGVVLSIIRIFLFACLSVLCSLAQPISSFASDNVDTPKPYKATTVDECIQEKECVWYHFLKAIQVEDSGEHLSEIVNIRKWGADVRFRRLGVDDRVSSLKIDDLLKQLVPFVSQPVSGNNKYNFAVVFTDDIEKELSGPFREPFRRAFGSDTLLDTYKETSKNDKERCFNFYIQDIDKNMQIFSYFAFIQKDHENIDLCLKNVLFSGFGLWAIADDVFPESQNIHSYSKLDVLLIFMLYQDYFKSAMSFEEVKETFNKIYDPFIKFVEEKGVLDEY